MRFLCALLTAAGSLLALTAPAQAVLNLAFEPEANRHHPLALWAHYPDPDYRFGIDSTVAYAGRGSLRVAIPAESAGRYAHLYTDRFPVDSLRGHAVVVRGKLRTRGFRGQVGLYAFAGSSSVGQNLARRDALDSLSADLDWCEITVEVPVGAAATAFGCGLRVLGTGTVWLDALEVLRDGRPYPDAPLPATGWGRPPAPPEPAPTAAETAWLRRALLPLPPPTALPASPAALAGLGAVVGAARLVGLGEVTHGSHEIFAYKSALFRYLVAQKDCRTLLLEANQGSCAALDYWLQTGQGDVRPLLARLGVWNTQEVLDLLRWMRAYNQRTPARPLALVGLDMQRPEPVLAMLRQALGPADAFAQTRLLRLQAALARLPRGGSLFDSRQPSQPADTALRAIRSTLADLRAGLDTRAKLRPANPNTADVLASLRTLEQYATFAALPLAQGGAYRDACLAENAAAAAQQRPGRLAVWAHNAHVGRQHGPDRSMGEWLHQQFGAGYVAVGFAFYEGGFAAEGNARFYAATAAAAPNGAFEAYFHSAGQPLALLNLRTVPALPATRWLAQNLLFRETGVRAVEYEFDERHNLPGEFDALVFIETSTAARHLE